MPPKRPASPPSEDTQTPGKVFISEAIHDRKSTFIGYYSPSCLKPKELQNRDDVRSASHRIVAWRLPSAQRTLLSSSRPIFRTGHDDDGESWAGKRVEKVMEDLDVQGVCMVARWYGGELLGPVRFTHIENVVKGAVDAARGGSTSKKARTEQAGAEMPTENKTMRPEELQRRKREVIETLRRRDESISTLRALLDSKRSTTAPTSSQPSTQTSPTRVLNYDAMPFNRLQALENARDMTIGFLLKEIDKAEGEATKKREEAAREDEAKAAREEAELDEAWEEMEGALREADAAAAVVAADKGEPVEKG